MKSFRYINILIYEELSENVSLKVLLNFSVHICYKKEKYAFLIMIFDTQTIQQKQKGSILKYFLKILKYLLNVTNENKK